MAFDLTIEIPESDLAENPAFLKVAGVPVLSRLILGGAAAGAGTISVTGRHALAAQRNMLVAEQAERERTGGCLREIDAAFAEHSEKWQPAMRNLADTPSNSVQGVVAKLRILAASMMG